MEKSDQDLSPNRKLIHFPISPAKDSFRKESRSVPDSQSLREGQGGEDLLELRLGIDSPKPPLYSPVKSMQASVSKQYVTSPLKPLPHQSDHQLPIPPPYSPVKSIQASVSKQYVKSPLKPLPHQSHQQLQKNQSEKCRVRKQDPKTPDKQRRCACISSECVKLYCICFKSGSYCNGTCTCLDCHNNSEYEEIRQKAVAVILARSPNRFKPKIVDSPKGDLTPRKHIKRCSCRNVLYAAGCMNYNCECYQGNVLCSDNCRCQDCINVEGKVVRYGLLGPQGSETNIQQTTNTPVKRTIDMSGDVNSPESKKRKSKDSSLE